MVTVRSAPKLLMMHVWPLTESQFAQVPNVEPLFAVAVTLIAVPVAKIALHVLAQLMPAGVLTTIPAPPPEYWTVKSAPDPPPPVPVKQITSASDCPVTIAPEDERPLASCPVLTVAETMLPPQTLPVAVRRPVELIENI